jgi:hypothetical protein
VIPSPAKVNLARYTKLSMLTGPFTGSSVVEIGAQTLRIAGEILSQVSYAAPEGAVGTPSDLDEAALTVSPVLHKPFSGGWILERANGDELVAVLAIGD